MTTATKTVHIFVEVTKTDHRKIEFEQDQVTGRQIKEKAGVPLDTDLAHRQEGQLELIGNDQVVRITNGDHFVALPAGSIS